MMRTTGVFGIVLLVLLSSGLVHAQEGQPPAPNFRAGDEPTLPPVIVTPDVREPSGTPSYGASGYGAPNVTSGGPNGQPSIYPSLSDQVFGKGDTAGLNGITRSEKSVFDIPSLGTVINREAIDQQQAADMFQALQNEVGVLMQSTARGQASPFVRGLTGQQVLILVDGVRMNNSIFRAGPNQYYNLIDPGQVERIEVIRGPESVLWGSDAIGGVINVVTRSAAQSRGNYTGGGFKEYFSTADTASYSRANIEGWVGQSGVFGGASYMNVNDLRRGGDLGVQPYTNYSQYAGDIKFNRMLDNDAMLTVALQHFEQQDVPRSDRFRPLSSGRRRMIHAPHGLIPNSAISAIFAYRGWPTISFSTHTRRPFPTARTRKARGRYAARRARTLALSMSTLSARRWRSHAISTGLGGSPTALITIMMASRRSAIESIRFQGPSRPTIHSFPTAAVISGSGRT